VVVVRLLAFLERLVVVRHVVRVELDQRQALVAGQLRQALADRGLARTGATGHADEERTG
jgi:hypothetical protein